MDIKLSEKPLIQKATLYGLSITRFKTKRFEEFHYTFSFDKANNFIHVGKPCDGEFHLHLVNLMK